MDSKPTDNLLNALVLRLRETAKAYSPGSEEAPAAILWTDPDSEWLPLIPLLKPLMPELLELGEYVPKERRGPVIWLKTALAGVLPDFKPNPKQVPVLYLPGVARHVLRQADQCPSDIQPLVELLYRGQTWTHKNGRDWSVEAFFIADEGLGLDLTQDNRTRNSLHSALAEIAQASLSPLRGRRLTNQDFDSLVVSDTPRDLLTWIGQGEAVLTEWSGEHWHAFRSRCRDDFGFDPEVETPIFAAEKLGLRQERVWQDLWTRFTEAPAHYHGVRERLDQAKPMDLITSQDETWPSHNIAEEKKLREGLESLPKLTQHEAQQKIAEFETSHAIRRNWVWASMGESPLALALESLHFLAENSRTIPSCTSTQELIDWYAENAWQVDEAVLLSLQAVTQSADRKAVTSAISTLYLPWLDELALQFQALADKAYPFSDCEPLEEGTCLLFVDGLRLDTGHQLCRKLELRSYEPRFQTRLAALPTVTATAKPAVSPISHLVSGADIPPDFRPNDPDGKELTHARFLKLLKQEKVEKVDQASPTCSGARARGWCETGRIDSRGHDLESELATQIPAELNQVEELIERLFSVGWQRIRIVTDHGWMLMPGGLPKHNLPAHLLESRWSRCAAIKGQSKPDIPTVEWTWNPNQHIAVPPGAAAFKANTEYSHGGLSPQECVLPVITIDRLNQTAGGDESPQVSTIKWVGTQRCRISVNYPSPGLEADLRTTASSAQSSICVSPKEVEGDGEVSLLVTDESLVGKTAFLTLLDSNHNLIAQVKTTIGG